MLRKAQSRQRRLSERYLKKNASSAESRCRQMPKSRRASAQAALFQECKGALAFFRFAESASGKKKLKKWKGQFFLSSPFALSETFSFALRFLTGLHVECGNSVFFYER